MANKFSFKLLFSDYFKKNDEIEICMEKTVAPGAEPKYKFKELRIYNSAEWLAEQKHKYRQVFDRYNTAFVYIELSFYNKMCIRDRISRDQFPFTKGGHPEHKCTKH